MSTDQEDENIQAILYSRPISDEEMLEMEEGASTPQRGNQRRLALLACHRTLEELTKLKQQNPEVFLDMRNCIEIFKVHAKAVADLAETAAFRMELADELALEPEELSKKLAPH